MTARACMTRHLLSDRNDESKSPGYKVMGGCLDTPCGCPNSFGRAYGFRIPDVCS